jgi:hypothetical protein
MSYNKPLTPKASDLKKKFNKRDKKQLLRGKYMWI